MKETKFILEWNLQKVIFQQGSGELEVIDIDVEQESFIYKGIEFSLEQNIEKALSIEFDKRFVEVNDFQEEE